MKKVFKTSGLGLDRLTDMGLSFSEITFNLNANCLYPEGGGGGGGATFVRNDLDSNSLTL